MAALAIDPEAYGRNQGTRWSIIIIALGLSGFAGYRLYLKNNSEKNSKMLFLQMKER